MAMSEIPKHPERLKIQILRFDNGELFFDTRLPGMGDSAYKDECELLEEIVFDDSDNIDQQIAEVLQKLDNLSDGAVWETMNEIAKAVWERAKISDVE